MVVILACMTCRRLFGFVLILLSFAALAFADFPSEKPYAGITYHFATRTLPPNRVHRVEIDLTDPHVSIRVSPGGADPDGEGKFQTTLMPTSDIAKRERFDIAVNGDFFQAQKQEGGFAIPGG